MLLISVGASVHNSEGKDWIFLLNEWIWGFYSLFAASCKQSGFWGASSTEDMSGERWYNNIFQGKSNFASINKIFFWKYDALKTCKYNAEKSNQWNWLL